MKVIYNEMANSKKTNLLMYNYNQIFYYKFYKNILITCHDFKLEFLINSKHHKNIFMFKCFICSIHSLIEGNKNYFKVLPIDLVFSFSTNQKLSQSQSV